MDSKLEVLMNKNLSEDESALKQMQQFLRDNIKPLKKFEGKIPVSAMEKALFVMNKKYGVRVRSVLPSMADEHCDKPIYCANIAKGSDTSFAAVYGETVYELLEKSTAMVFAIVAESKR